MHIKKAILCFALLSSYFSAAVAQDAAYDPLLKKIYEQMQSDIVVESVKAQNERYGKLSQTEIDKVDAQWKKERESKQQPLIAATLTNPLSSYLTRIQAHSTGVYVELFVMDKNGLNVGQSDISSDYWQGDEAKWQKTFGAKSIQPFIDAPEYDDEIKARKQQMNITIWDKARNEPIGAATIEINLDEYLRRK